MALMRQHPQAVPLFGPPQPRPGVLGQLGEVGGQLLQGLNPVPMVQGAYQSLANPLERIQQGGDMQAPIGRGPGFRTGPTRSLGDAFRRQEMLDMFRDTQRDLNTQPVMSTTKAFALEALQNYKMRNLARDQAARRRARLDQVQRFREDVDALNIPEDVSSSLAKTDMPIFMRLMQLRQGVQSRINEGELTSRTPGAAEELEHIQNRFQQGLEIGRQRAAQLPPHKQASPSEKAQELQARRDRAMGTLAELGPGTMWETADVTAARRWAHKELQEIENESFSGMQGPPHADLLRRGVESYMRNLPRNKNPLRDYPR